jgi:2-dehydro-3-deoxygluconokinase
MLFAAFPSRWLPKFQGEIFCRPVLSPKSQFFPLSCHSFSGLLLLVLLTRFPSGKSCCVSIRGEGRVRVAREFKVWEGGGEYNVARGLRRCFGLRTGVVTAFADNDVGRLIEDFILQGGVDTSFIKWTAYDGIGRTVRNGLNFTERGFGIRGAKGTPDRGNTAASQMKPGDVDWDHLFGKLGVRWFHTGGIFAALSESTAELTIEACRKAREHGTIVSYDLNYRPSLWKSIGGQAKAREVNREIARHVDVMIGNEEDFTASLGFEVEGVTEHITGIDVTQFKKMIETAVREFPNFQVAATTLREVHTATVNDWGAILWHDGAFYEATPRPRMEIMDRVGGGDSFASGLVYGFLQHNDPRLAVEYGAAHGALAMTTPGDTSMATVGEVEKLIGGGSARVER